MQSRWWDNTAAAWGFLIISVGAGAVLSFLAPRYGIPIGILLVILGILLLLRAYHKRKTGYDKLRESLISARARAEALLGIKTHADSASVLKIIKHAYHRYGVAVTYLKKERAEHPEYNDLIDLLQRGQADLNTLIQSELSLSTCKSKIDDDAKNIIKAIDDIISSRIHSGNKQMQPQLITEKEKEPRLAVEGLPKCRWHGARLGRSWRLLISNVGFDEAVDCRGQLIAIASIKPEIDKGLNNWPVHEYLNWSTGSESISIPSNGTMELEIANYEGYGSPVYLAYAKGEDFRKQHALKSFYVPIILVVSIWLKSSPPLYCVCLFHPHHREDDNLELIKVTSEKPDIRLYQTQDFHNGDSQI